MLAVYSNFPKYHIPGNLIITTLDKESRDFVKPCKKW